MLGTWEVMMHYAFFSAAIALVLLARLVMRIDQVHGISLYGASLVTGIWGFIIAPTLAQVGLEILVFAWAQLRFFAPKSN